MESPVAQDLTNQLAKDPENWDVRCRLAEQLVMEGRGAEAVTVLDSADEPPEYEPHILKAAEIYSAQDPRRAVPLLHAYLTECPESSLGHLAMAVTAAKLGDISGATQYYEVALSLNKAYRDPDFEEKYGISIENAPPAMTAKTATVPLPLPSQADEVETAEPQAEIEPSPVPEPDFGDDVEDLPRPAAVEEAKEQPATNAEPAPGARSRRKTKSGRAMGCVLMLVTAVAVFLLCWLVTILIVKANLGGG